MQPPLMFAWVCAQGNAIAPPEAIYAEVDDTVADELPPYRRCTAVLAWLFLTAIASPCSDSLAFLACADDIVRWTLLKVTLCNENQLQNAPFCQAHLTL